LGVLQGAEMDKMGTLKRGWSPLLLNYLLKDFLLSLAVCMFGLVLVLTLGNVFDELNRVIRNGPPVWAIMAYFAYKVPYNVTASAPLAVLIGTLFTLTRMLRSHELIAMRAGGMSQYAIAAPFLVVSIMVSMLVLAFDETVLPWANGMRSEIKKVHIRKLPLHEWMTVKRAAIWTSAGRLVFAREANGEEGVLKRVTIVEFAGRKPVGRIDALSARPVKGAWSLEQAQVYRWRGPTRVSLNRAARGVYPATETMEDFLQEDRPLDAMTMSDLKIAIERLRKAGKYHGAEQVFYYFKWAFPFASFIVALLGLGISFAFQKNPREGMAASVFVAVVSAVGYLGLVKMGETLGVGGVLPPLLAVWIANIVFLAAGLVLLWRAWRW